MAGNGFFGWIRDGVRQSVLLGFSDAVEQLGSPSCTGELNPELAAVLRSAPAASAAPVPVPFGPARSERKRLGRSLQQIHGRPSSTTSGDDSPERG